LSVRGESEEFNFEPAKGDACRHTRIPGASPSWKFFVSRNPNSRALRNPNERRYSATGVGDRGVTWLV